MIRYWHDDKEMICFADGELKENGDFCYQGTFGINTRYYGDHFATSEEAIFDLIKNIDSDINELQQRKSRLLRQLTGEFND